MEPLRISSALNLHYYPKDSLSDYIREGLLFHKRMGFDAADLDMELFEKEADLTPIMERALSDSRELGIRFELCHLPYSAGNSKTEERLERFRTSMHRSIDAAALLGVDYAVMHPNTLPMPMKDFRLQTEYDRVMKHLAPFVEHAARVGLSVAIENLGLYPAPYLQHRYCQTPEELCDLADALGIGICWDFGHANLNGVRQSEGLAYIGNRLKVLHVNDNFGIVDEHLAPFMGQVDWKDAMEGLRQANFNGLLNFELSAWRIPQDAREAYAAYVLSTAKALLAY